MYHDPDYADELPQLKAALLRLKDAVGDTDEEYPELMQVRDRRWD